MPLGGKDTGPVIEALDAQQALSSAARSPTPLNLKFAPDIRFLADDTFDEASRIDALLASERVRRDVDK